MSIFLKLTEAFGTQAQLAEVLGLPYQTVAAWFRRQSIPAKHWRQIILAAEARGINISPDDLLAAPSDREAAA